MPNIASVLKEEIARVARKEVRSETASLKKSASSHRTEIAALKRRTQALERELHRLINATAKPQSTATAEASPQRLRFSAKGLASQRKRLGLSAEDVGLLLGASGQSVYNWEAGEARPRNSHLPAIAALKTLGKKDAIAHLNALKASGK
jgi:DNA-binding transcriptional regulator YiaG